MDRMTLTEQRLTRIWSHYSDKIDTSSTWFDLNEELWDIAITLRDCTAAPWAVELFTDAAELALARAVYSHPKLEAA